MSTDPASLGFRPDTPPGSPVELPPIYYAPPGSVKLWRELDKRLAGITKLQQKQAALITEAVQLHDHRPAVLPATRDARSALER